MIDRAEITGVILCGGAGSRLGAGEKPLTLLHDRPLVAHVRARLAPQVGPLCLSANHALDEYAAWSDIILADTMPGLGPLGGLATALAHCTTPYLFCCPGDAPFLPADVVARLADAFDDSAIDLAVPHDGEQMQQLFLLTRRKVAPSLTDYLSGGGRAVRGWFDRLRVAVVAMPSRRAGFLNVNTMADLDKARRQLLTSGVSA